MSAKRTVTCLRSPVSASRLAIGGWPGSRGSCAGACAASPSAGVGSVETAGSADPHCMQKRAPDAASSRQFGQASVWAAPQFGQNRAPRGFSTPQPAQINAESWLSGQMSQPEYRGAASAVQPMARWRVPCFVLHATDFGRANFPGSLLLGDEASIPTGACPHRPYGYFLTASSVEVPDDHPLTRDHPITQHPEPQHPHFCHSNPMPGVAPSESAARPRRRRYGGVRREDAPTQRSTRPVRQLSKRKHTCCRRRRQALLRQRSRPQSIAGYRHRAWTRQISDTTEMGNREFLSSVFRRHLYAICSPHNGLRQRSRPAI